MALVVRTLKVVPSTRVSHMEICSADDENLVLKNNDEIDWLAGGLLENLFYKLYDEAGREVPPTAEIASMIKVCLAYTCRWCGDKLKKPCCCSKSVLVFELPLFTLTVFKVNWTGDANMEDLVQGKLPDVHVPSQVQEKRFYQVSYKDQSVSVSFHIV